MDRMQARRIPGTGHIAFREWTGYTWSQWSVVVDPLYHRAPPSDPLARMFEFYGTEEYRHAVDALAEPAFSPPQPDYPKGSPPLEPKHLIPMHGLENERIALGWQRALLRPDSVEFTAGDIAELVGWGSQTNILVRLMHIARHESQSSVSVPKGFCLLTVRPIAHSYPDTVAGMVGGDPE